MKDEYGNGMTNEEMNALTELAVSYKNRISQDGNNHIIYNHKWHFRSPNKRYHDTNVEEQKRVIEAWQTLDKPQGIHLDVCDATISFSEKVSIEQYYEWLTRI